MIQQIITVLKQQVEGISVISLVIVCIWACVLVGIALLILVLCFHKEFTWLTIFMWLCLTIYLCALMFLTLGNRELGSRDDVRWIPFDYLMLDNGQPNVLAWILAGFNLTLFLPFGTIVTILQKNVETRLCFLYVTLESFLLSTVIEMVQRIAKLGYFETEDIILNTLGGIAGCCVARLIIFLVRRNRDNSLYF